VAALINEAAAEVSVDAQTWKFALDVGRGTACIEIEGARFTLHAQSWQQKRMLARFAHLGETFLEDQLLRSSLVGVASLPEGSAREALVALARWINGPCGNAGLPLDQQLLARVTLQVCRAMQAAPQALDSLDAAEVEMLWQAARLDAPETEQADAHANRILIVPDAGAIGDRRCDPTGVAPASDPEPQERSIVVTKASPSIQPDTADESAARAREVSVQQAPLAARPDKAQRRHTAEMRVDARRFRVRFAVQERPDRSRLEPTPLSADSDTRAAAHFPTAIPGAPTVQAPALPSTSPAMRPAWAASVDEPNLEKSHWTPSSAPASDAPSWTQPPMKAAVMYPLSRAELTVDSEQLFDELATRLEQAVAEQGIDLEP
jgi:hypothetical protein